MIFIERQCESLDIVEMIIATAKLSPQIYRYIIVLLLYVWKLLLLFGIDKNILAAAAAAVRSRIINKSYVREMRSW